MRKRRIIAAVIIVAAAVFASFFGGAARTLFYMSMLIPLLSVAYTFYVYLRFRIYQDAENKIIVKGEKTPYFFVLSDEDYIAYTDIRVEFLDDFSTVQDMELSHSYCLVPGEKNEYHTDILCHYRGEYNIGVKSIIVTDLLGLMNIRYPAPSTIRMSVLPKLSEIENISLAPLDEDAKLLRYSHSASDEPPDCEIRKYIQGDSIKLINWKVSAKKRELFIRQSSDTHNNSIVFVMDMTQIRSDDYTRIVTEDKIIECALTTADFLVRKNVGITVVYEQDEIMYEHIDSPLLLKAFYVKCAGIKFCASLTPSQLSGSLTGLTLNGFVIFAVSALTYELCETCENIIRLGGDAAVLLAGDSGAENIAALDKRVIFRQIKLSDEVSDILGGTDEH
ncbi:MAG: DUF58 domain-containing protein [Oscillospiraceae bacterium]|nr:DUF58 domain-containing protein [Oscillospiraceae bacterium]